MSASTVERGLVDESWPDVYTKPPVFDKELAKRPGALTLQQFEQFWNDGVVLISDFFDIEKELEPCRSAIVEEVEEMAQKLYKAGKIKNMYSDKGLFDRLSYIEQEFPGTSVLMHKGGTLKQAFKDLWSNERLLNMMEQLIGPNISGHPVWNLRTKCPSHGESVVPWHQDNGYTDNNSYGILIPTAWIPLLDTNETNGCMEFAVGGHRTGKVAKHTCCAGGTWYLMIEPEDMQDTLGVNLKQDLKVYPVPYGSFLLFNNAIPHRSLDNNSNEIRWSLDLRWQATDAPANFYGLKQHVPFRKQGEPNFKIDWDILGAGTCRNIKTDTQEEEESEFDTTIHGPWMIKWDVVHHNRHSANVDGNVSWHKN